MRVASWNLGYWQHQKYHNEAWEYLRDVIRPDIALLQETVIPTLAEDESVIFSQIRKPWGTAVYAKGIRLDKLPTTVNPPRVAAATLDLTVDGAPIYVVSIHAPVIDGRVFPQLSNIFEEVQRLVETHPSIVGGDLNTARLAEKVWPGYGHGPFFEKLERGPFTDCHRQFEPTEIQTFFRRGSLHPFQDDHLFTTTSLAKRLTSCRAINDAITQRVSDHIPLVATFELRDPNTFDGATSA